MSTGLEPQAFFGGGHGADKERSERAMERQERAKVIKIAIIGAAWGSKK